MRGSYSFARVIGLYSVLFALACGALFAVLFGLRVEREIWLAVGGFALAAAGLFAGFVLAIRKRMTTILDKLSLTVQSLINGQAREEFPVSEDNLLSKLQEQVLKLSGILRMQKIRYKEESEEIRALITDITHQLRTPLANLSMYSGLLTEEGTAADRKAEFARIVRDQTAKLAWLTDGLVKLSRLDTGIIAIHAVRHNLADTVLVAIRTAYPAASGKGVEILFDGRQDIELPHDAKWTGEAIGNMLDNAVKYMPETGGRIKVSIEPYELFARIDIADDGRGIPEHEIPRIFQRFYRGAASSDIPGVGIGLYLARKIVTEQGGYIKVASQVGAGSVFSVFLPLDLSIENTL